MARRTRAPALDESIVDEIIAALERCDDLDERGITVGNGTVKYSPNYLIQELKGRTPFGRRFYKNREYILKK
ncbi:MAG TPA: hypothetical protein ENH99_02875 [Candidatus Pacearchaeota archaeon]|nr:hypothetical protein [Candidatus Pacearchaeota archaeon]